LITNKTSSHRIRPKFYSRAKKLTSVPSNIFRHSYSPHSHLSNNLKSPKITRKLSSYSPEYSFFYPTKSILSACKTFFRRSCLSGAQYGCKLQANCDIRSGVHCRSCRYDQCFRLVIFCVFKSCPDLVLRKALNVVNSCSGLVLR
jgi:hypothetical protein